MRKLRFFVCHWKHLLWHYFPSPYTRNITYFFRFVNTFRKKNVLLEPIPLTKATNSFHALSIFVDTRPFFKHPLTENKKRGIIIAMKTRGDTVAYKIFDYDPYLKPFEEDINLRMRNYKAKKMELLNKYTDKIELVYVQYVGQMIKALNLRNKQE